jgi:GAF domain-containing protein
VLRFYKAGSDAHWTEDELALLVRLSEQLGQALESVRLYQDVQRGAARDRLIARVTGRMRESLQVDAVLQAAVQEMRRALFLSEVEVRIGKVSGSKGEAWPALQPGGGDGNSTQD